MWLLPGLAATIALGIEAFEMFCFINLIYQTAGELLHMVMGIMEMHRLNTKCEWIGLNYLQGREKLTQEEVKGTNHRYESNRDAQKC